jgi:hypothetical protein
MRKLDRLETTGNPLKSYHAYKLGLDLEPNWKGLLWFISVPQVIDRSSMQRDLRNTPVNIWSSNFPEVYHRTSLRRLALESITTYA